MTKKRCLTGLLLLGLLFVAIFMMAANKEELSTPYAKPPYFLSVCTVFKNEAPYLKEWIEYHKLLGVQHFRLYNDGSTDNYLDVLSPYIASGDVNLIEWKKEPGNGVYAWINTIQTPAFFDSITQLRDKTKWLAIIDVDEFILPTAHPDIVSFLKKYDQYAGILINWQCFGTSHLMDIPPDKLMIEVLTLKAGENTELNYPVKSIVKPEFIDTSTIAWAPHTWTFLPPHKATYINGKEFVFGNIDIDEIRINHYVHRSETYFWNEKIPKKNRMEGYKCPAAYVHNWHASCNAIEDKSIFPWVPALRKKVISERL